MPYVETPGARIHYTKAGSGPPVLLIQGAGVVGEAWRPQVAALAPEYTVYSFDNRGIGRSTLAQSRRVTIEEMAADALAIMDAERVGTFHIAAHSMGGLIAQALALHARQRVTSLALLCTFVRGTEGARMSPAMMLTALRMRIGTRTMRRNAFLELIMPAAYLRTADRPRLAGDMALLFGYDLASQPPFVMRQVRAMARYDAAARWSELADVPTLVVTAAHDRIARPEYGRELASRIHGARYVEIPDAGHGVTIHRAEVLNALLREHLAAAEAGRRPDSSFRTA